MEIAVVAVGLGVGVLYGVFGAGGSAFATPALALLGVPPLAAIASPLPATLPGAAAGAWSYVRRRDVHMPTLRRALVGGLPATIAGALCAPLIGGPRLLVVSGGFLAVIGLRMAWSRRESDERATSIAPGAVIALTTMVGFVTGLLANSGGFLLVPLFVLVLRLDMRHAAGTSLLTAAAFSIPTVATHWALGDIDWAVALAFGLGMVPGAFAGGRLSGCFVNVYVQRTFGVLLTLSSVAFLLRVMW